MAFVLVALSGDNKVYYNLDAGQQDPDGVVEMEDGTTVSVDFFSFVIGARNIKKLRTTAFHRRLWDEPQDRNMDAWERVFVLKEEKVNKTLLADVDILPSVGRKKSSLRQKNHAAMQFINSGVVNGLNTKSCCGGETHIPHTKKMVFSSGILRKEAWIASAALREIEEI